MLHQGVEVENEECMGTLCMKVVAYSALILMIYLKVMFLDKSKTAPTDVHWSQIDQPKTMSADQV
jgi:hypothetical protein